MVFEINIMLKCSLSDWSIILLESSTGTNILMRYFLILKRPLISLGTKVLSAIYYRILFKKLELTSALLQKSESQLTPMSGLHRTPFGKITIQVSSKKFAYQLTLSITLSMLTVDRVVVIWRRIGL